MKEEEILELEYLINETGFSGKEFMDLARIGYKEECYNETLIPFANALITIQNQAMKITQHKSEVDAINLRLDLAGCPHDVTASPLVLPNNVKPIKGH